MDAKTDDKSAGKCRSRAAADATNREWWPDALDVSVAPSEFQSVRSDGQGLRLRQEYNSLDLNAVIKDLPALMTDSQPWWPADFGHYGGLFIRLAWHSAGTYRTRTAAVAPAPGSSDSPAEQSGRTTPTSTRPRRLLWPIKQKYGQKISWADLFVLVGNVALESMGFKTFGFAGGRKDYWEPQELYWGPEGTWLGGDAYSGERQLSESLGACRWD